MPPQRNLILSLDMEIPDNYVLSFNYLQHIKPSKLSIRAFKFKASSAMTCFRADTS